MVALPIAGRAAFVQLFAVSGAAASQKARRRIGTPPLTDTAPAVATPVLKTFSDFSVDERVCAALAEAGILNPFPIQELTLPLALAGADLIGQARTGTGKTLAFGIPLVQRALKADNDAPVALVIVPTRELCLQVRDDLAAAAAQTGVQVLAVYGGKAIDVQIDALVKGVDIVVGTPGRLLDLLHRGDLKLGAVSGLVLDEADEMLDLGFLPDVEELIQATAPQRQTLLFSATMPSAVVALARRYMNKPTFMRADVEEVRIAPDTAQHFFSCHRMDKPAVLARILQSPGRGRCVVFSRTKRMADVLVEELRGQGVLAAAIHSDLRQDARERALRNFRSGETDVLVATEVAARGLDITDVTHVVNYDCPDDEKMYLHRIGRTGRAGAAGVAITLAVWNELARLEMIKKALGITDETHEVFSTSPILQELFDLPPSVKVQRESTRSTPSKDRESDRGRGQSKGQRRGGRREQAEPVAAAAAPATQAEDAPAEAAEADETAAAETGRPRPARRRRSTRRGPAGTRPVTGDDAGAEDGAARDAETSAPAPAADTSADTSEDAASSAAKDGETGDVVRRVRTRRRPAASEQPKPAAPPPPRAERTADDDESDRPPRQSTRSSASSTRSQRGGRGRTSERTNARGTSRDSGRSGRGSRSPRPAPVVVDAAEARGTGRPRLTRPLVIAYLP